MIEKLRQTFGYCSFAEESVLAKREVERIFAYDKFITGGFV